MFHGIAKFIKLGFFSWSFFFKSKAGFYIASRQKMLHIVTICFQGDGKKNKIVVDLLNNNEFL